MKCLPLTYDVRPKIPNKVTDNPKVCTKAGNQRALGLVHPIKDESPRGSCDNKS